MNITSKSGFRTLIIVSFLSAFGSAVDRVFPSLLRPELQELFRSAEVTTEGMVMAVVRWGFE